MTKNKQPLIKIEYENSFSAKELAEYLVSLNDEFKSFITENNYGDLISNELSIKEIKQGSLEIYPFLEYAASALPLLDQIQVFIDFFNEWLLIFSH